MSIKDEKINALVDFVSIDKFYVSFHFKCKIKGKTVISTVPFEPFEGKIEFTWQDILFHPVKSYNKYYHTPITIYGGDSHHTILLKAFQKVSKYFVWDSKDNMYIYN